MATMRLHWFWSTNPQKVRLALVELGLDHEVVRVDLTAGEQKTAAYLSVNPRGKVPALEVDDTVLWESGAALAYLGQREGRLWPDTPGELAMAMNLLFLESSAFQDQASVYFYNRVVLPFVGAEPDLDRVKNAARKIQPLFQVLSDQLGDNHFLLGEFSLVDCAYAPWLPVLDLEEFPRLTAWSKRLVSRPSWAACEFTY